MSLNHAVYVGSFDPPTVGHIHVITQATKICHPRNLVVAVANNPAKKTMFTIEERVALLEKIRFEMDFCNVRIKSFDNQYAVNYAHQLEANFLIRGIRNSNDFIAEQAMQEINRGINPQIETIFIVPPADFSSISSSAIKSMIGLPGWQQAVAPYLHYSTINAIAEKEQNK